MLLTHLPLKTSLLSVCVCLVTAKAATQTSSRSSWSLTGDNLALTSSVDKTWCCTVASMGDLLRQAVTLC